MSIDWAKLTDEQAVDTLFHHAAAHRVEGFAIALTETGAEIRFERGGPPVVFDRIDADTAARMCRRLKAVVGIEPYQEPPQVGVCDLRLDSEEYSLEASTSRGPVGEDVHVRLFRL